MRRRAFTGVSVLALGVAAASGCRGRASSTQTPADAAERTAASAPAQACDPASETWIQDWFSAWELVADEVMALERGAAPTMVLFDQRCVWTTSPVTAAGAEAVPGPRLFGESLAWRAKPHEGALLLPDGKEVPVALLSFTSTSEEVPFFVMASPGFWKRAGVSSDVIEHEAFVTGVFLHEFSHARHVNSFTGVLDEIEETWVFPEEFTSDVIQARFGGDREYVAAYEAERDALHAAIDAATPESARDFAKAALQARRDRQAKYFDGENAVFRTIDDVLVTTEGAAQWAAFAWLTHPRGAGLSDAVAREGWGTRGGQVRVGGLALFMTVDRLLPSWQPRVFAEDMTTATELLRLAAGD